MKNKMEDLEIDDSANSDNLEDIDYIDIIDYRMGFGSWRPTWLQYFNSINWFSVILSVCSLTQGIVVYGLVAVSVESIEKEFGVSSKISGLILACQHASTLLIVTYVSFFGGKGNKPKWLGIGALVTGVGAIIFASPKLLIGRYKPLEYNDQMKLDICSSNTTSWKQNSLCNDKYSTQTVLHMFIFMIGQLIMGAGTTPHYTLGPAYLDENVAPQMSPIYLGIWFTFATMGPALGFAIGGAFLKIYTDIDKPIHTKLKANDAEWVGAWWLGFVTISIFFMMTGVLILLYPKQLKSGDQKRKEAIKVGHLLPSDTHVIYTFKGYLKECFKLCLNKIFMLMVFGTTIQAIYGAGMFGFLIKVLILKFGVTSVKASVVMGIALIIAMIGGIMGGSYLMKRIEVGLAAKSGAKICSIVSFLVMTSSVIWVIPGCQNTSLAGVMTPYVNSTGSRSLSSTCNSNCKCSARYYNPICGSDGITYYSPCYAGCSHKVELKSKGLVFTNCSCINLEKSKTFTNLSSDNEINDIRATSYSSYGYSISKKCNRKCRNFYFFILLGIIVSIVAGLAGIPNKIVIMRCVADNKRSFALGMNTLIIRLFVLPGPVLMGAIVDTDCIAWAYDTCGNKKHCLDYDIDLLSKKLVWFGCLTAAIGTMSYILGWWLCPSAEGKEKRPQLDVLQPII